MTRRVQFQAVLFAVLMVLSLPAMALAGGFGTVGAESDSEEMQFTGINTTTSYNHINQIVLDDDGNLYAGLDVDSEGDEAIIKYDAENLQEIDKFHLDNFYGMIRGHINGIYYSDGYLYATSTNNRLYKISSDSLAIQDSIDFGSNLATNIESDGTHLYFGDFDGVIRKVDKETFTVTDQYTSTNNIEYVSYKEDGTIYYVNRDDRVNHLDTESMTRIQEGEVLVERPTELKYIEESNSIAVRLPGASEIPILDGSSLQVIDTINMPSNSLEYPSDGYLYVWNSDTGLSRVNTDTHDVVDNLQMEEVNLNPNANLVHAAPNGYLYVSDSSGRIAKVDPNTAIGDSNPLTGTVTDQHGDPVENATVEAWGISETPFDESTATDLEREIRALENELGDVEPDAWTDFEEFADGDLLDLSDFRSEIGSDLTYPLVHQPEDWDARGGFRTTHISSELDDPRVMLDENEPAIITLWDPDENRLRPTRGPVRNSFYGEPVDGTIVVEQLDSSGVYNTREYDTDTPVVESRLTSDIEHPTAQIHLPVGVYRAYPEGNPAAGYVFTVGDPDDIFQSWASDLEQTVANLEDRADAFEEEIELRANADFDHLLNEGIAVRERTTTDESGEFELSADASVRAVNVQAYKADDEIVDVLEGVGETPSLSDVSIDDLREYRLQGYNGTVYLPTTVERVDTTDEEPHVDLTMYRTEMVPLDDMERFEELREWLENEFLNQTVEDLDGLFDDVLEDLETEELQDRLERLAELLEENDELWDEYLDESDLGDRLDDEELEEILDDFTDDELREELERLREQLNELEERQISPGDPVVDDGLLSVRFPLFGSADAANVEVVWNDGETDTIPEDYWHIESGGLFGTDAVVVEDFPFEAYADGRSVADVRVETIGDDGRERGSVEVVNPEFDGTLPRIDAVTFNTLAPADGERVSVGVDPADEYGYSGLVAVDVFGPNGQIDADVDTIRDRASFRADGEGIHHVRLTLESSTGEQFTVVERVRAGEAGRNDPATVRLSSTTLGTHAVVGERIDTARASADGNDLEVTVVAPTDEIPSSVHLMPQGVVDDTDHTIDVEVVHGSDERSVSSKLEVVVHYDSLTDGTHTWRGSPAWIRGEPVAEGAPTRYGDVQVREDGDKYLVTVITDPSGQATVTVDQDPGRIDSIRYWLALNAPTIPWIPLAVNFVAGSVLAGILALFRRRGFLRWW